MMKKLILLICCIASMQALHAQSEWQWPTDEALKTVALEKQAFYQIQMGMENNKGALSTLHWLYKNNPQLHPAIYKDGAKVIEALLDTELTPARQIELEDSLLWMYDQRIDYFNDVSAVDRKAYTAFKLYYKNSEKYALLSDLYDTLFSLTASDISLFNLTPYMTLGVYYYKSNPEKMSGEQVIAIYDKVTGVIDEKLASGESEKKLNKEQSKVDALFNTVDLLNCQFIEEKIVPKFRENPTDITLIKKVFTYSLRAKCMDQPYFLEAAESLDKNDPNAKLEKTIGDRYFTSEDYPTAINYYQKAQSLATDKEDKYDLLYKQALSYSRLGNKTEARKKAIEALNYKSEDAKALDLIGNLYFTSYEECKGGESRVIDRATFLAAYEMYRRSGNKEMMEQAKAQFPSIEEIFNEGMQEGDKITVSCWIQTQVELQRR